MVLTKHEKNILTLFNEHKCSSKKLSEITGIKQPNISRTLKTIRLKINEIKNDIEFLKQMDIINGEITILNDQIYTNNKKVKI